MDRLERLRGGAAVDALVSEAAAATKAREDEAARAKAVEVVEKDVVEEPELVAEESSEAEEG